MKIKKLKRYNEPRLGPTAQKILLLLLSGTSLGFSYSPKQYAYIIKSAKKDWEKINRRTLYQAIATLYKSKLIDEKDNLDDSTTIILTDQGKKKALTYKIDEIKVPEMKKWDKKWRIILFDIPEHKKKARNALAHSLKQMGFYQFQKSVFVHPFECYNEIEFVIEFWEIRPYTRYIVAEHIDNELHLKTYFGLH
ncbi:MAG: CRISPR-associated endonuclease Cas2 [Patescibacteria group bacterium]